MCGWFSCVPYWGLGPQPRHVPWLGIEPATLWFTACAQSTELHQPVLYPSFLTGYVSFYLHLKMCLLILERRKGRERDRERNINVRNISWLPLAHTLTGNQTYILGMCPNQESNLLPFGLWGLCSNQATPDRADCFLLVWFPCPFLCF